MLYSSILVTELAKWRAKPINRIHILNNFIVNAFYNIDDLITLVKNKKDREAIYMIYTEKGADGLKVGMNVYVGDVPEFDDNDDDIFQASVVALGFECGYMREHFQDVVDLAYKQKPTASTEEILRCLNYFAQHDDFLDLR